MGEIKKQNKAKKKRTVVRKMTLEKPQKKKSRRGRKSQKEKYNSLYIDPEKKAIIKEILKLRPNYIKINLNLNKFTLEQLEFHYNRIKKEGK